MFVFLTVERRLRNAISPRDGIPFCATANKAMNGASQAKPDSSAKVGQPKTSSPLLPGSVRKQTAGALAPAAG